jgi:hypothetical protein
MPNIVIAMEIVSQLATLTPAAKRLQQKHCSQIL